MNGIHPKLGLRLATYVTLVAGAVGCSNQPGALKNPFSAAERVPPPSTRMLAPGTAQPYYQGDPLPVMQSATPFPAPTSAITSSAPATKVDAAAASLAPVAEPTKLAFSNEPKIAIPSDGDSVRFALPPPEPEPVPSPASVAQAQLPQTVAASTPGAPARPVAMSAVPASHGEPAAGVQPVASAVFNLPADTAPSGPWRSPQILPPTSVPRHTPQVFSQPVAAAPIQGYPPPISQPSMDVELRAVASPEPVAPTTPRIRLPGYPSPQPTMGASATEATTTGLQLVQIAPGPPQGYFDPSLGTFVYTGPPVGSILAPASVATNVGGDGFRPRSSMR